MPAQNNSRRLNICTTENYLQNYNPLAVPRNSSYANVSKFGKKNFAVGHSLVERFKRLDFNKKWAVVKPFLDDLVVQTANNLTTMLFLLL